MHATVRSYSAGSEFVDALVEHEGDIRAVITQLAGFRAYYLIRTPGGDAVTISVFDDESAAEESTRAAAAWVAENLGDMSVAPPQVTTGKVVLNF